MIEDYDAYIDQFYLNIETIEDGFEKAIAEHEFPGTDGALVEDMGQKARRITIRCYFINEYYENHFDFIDHLEKKELFELQHPKYGHILGTIKSVNIRHDDRQKTAEVDLTFVENLRSKVEPLISRDVELKTEQSLEQGLDEQVEAFNQNLLEATGPEGEKILNRDLDPAAGIIEQFTDITGKARSYLKTIDKNVKALEEKFPGEETPVKSIVDNIEYATNLAGRVLSTTTKAVDRLSGYYNKAKVSAAKYERSFRKGVAQLESAIESAEKSGIFSEAQISAANNMINQVKIAAALRLGLDMGAIYAEDQEKRRELKNQEGVKSFDVEGNYIKSFASPQLLTIDDIETSLASSREYLQTVIDSDRSLQSVKDMAYALQEHVAKVKLESEKLINISIENDLPIHLVCHMHGLSYDYAERILAVNRIRHPNFIKGNIKIYA